MSCTRLDDNSAACERHIAEGNCLCCFFVTGNFIMLLPGEEHLLESPNLHSVTHSDPYRVWCDAFAMGCNECPLGDAKPADCKFYPTNPYKVNLEEGKVEWIYAKGRCSMTTAEMKQHAQKLQPQVLEMCNKNPKLVAYFQRTAEVFRSLFGSVFEDEL